MTQYLTTHCGHLADVRTEAGTDLKHHRLGLHYIYKLLPPTLKLGVFLAKNKPFRAKFKQIINITRKDKAVLQSAFSIM